jgi:hypothetical protein
MRIKVRPSLGHVRTDGWNGSLLPYGWESMTPEGWPWMLAPNLDGALMGLRGLGQDPSVDLLGTVSGYDVMSDGSVFDASGIPVTDFSGIPTSLTNQIDTLLGNTPIATSPTPAISAILNQGTSTGLTPAQIAQIISSSAGAATSILRSTESPYRVPGTNLVYNPATGQIMSSLGITGSALGTALTPVAMNGLMMAGIALVGLVVVMNMMKK